MNVPADEVKSFISLLKDKSDKELSEIIGRYISYRPETVDAALFVSVDKGLITYEIKEKLWSQISANFDNLDKLIRSYSWESDNAFLQYIKAYTDDDLYSIIEDPHGLAIDMFHAVLFSAKARELISAKEFTTLYSEAKALAGSEDIIPQHGFGELFVKPDFSGEFVTETEVEEEKEKFWKCPKCNEMVSMDLAVCWNCQTEIAEQVEHPTSEEIVNYRKSEMSVSPVKGGLALVGAGIILLAFDQLQNYSHLSSLLNHLGGYIFGGIIILIGIILLVFGIFFNSGKD